MKKHFLFFSFLASTIAFGQSATVSKSLQTALDRVDSNTIRSHVAYLADDKLKGRLPGTEGYQMAVDYVTNQFKQMGVTPGGDAGNYTQRLVIRKATLVNATATAVLQDAAGNTDSLVFAKDFVPVPHPLQASATASGGLLFAGYGVHIPGGYSDYDGQDAKGKIVVIVSGAPAGLPSTLAAHFSNAGNKFTTAFARGAAGVVLVDLAARPGNGRDTTVQLNVTLNPEKTVAYGRRFTGNGGAVVGSNKALLRRLFLQSGKNLEQTLASIKGGKPASTTLPYSMKLAYQTSHNDFESFNVVGLIPGTDKKAEYVVHSAHLDHLGVGRPVNGDSIYNGAHDNASGVASLLEIARLYKTSGVKPRRSILIVMVTGEEMGLIGSSYFAANPTVPKTSIVADVNTDMPTVIAPLLSVVPLGAEHSSLMKHVQFAANHLKLDIEPDPEPSEVRFVRSDQYSFVTNGIPALHIKYGSKSNIPGFDMVKFVQGWRAKYYHKPQDGMDGIFNFTAAKTYVQLNFLISYSVAQTSERPRWNDGDLFATTAQ